MSRFLKLCKGRYLCTPAIGAITWLCKVRCRLGLSEDMRDCFSQSCNAFIRLLVVVPTWSDRWLLLRRYLSCQIPLRNFSFQISLPSIMVTNRVLPQHIRSLAIIVPRFRKHFSVLAHRSEWNLKLPHETAIIRDEVRFCLSILVFRCF